MSKLSRKRVRVPGPVTSTQQVKSSDNSNRARPSPPDRNEIFFQRQLEAAIEESKENCITTQKCGKFI